MRLTSERLLITGSIRRPPAGNLIGVVKSTAATVYDPSVDDLRMLPFGHVGHPFSLLPHHTGEQVVWSAYLRPHPPQIPWNWGLVPIETADRALPEAAAATYFQFPQPLGCGDKRADRHLSAIRHVDEGAPRSSSATHLSSRCSRVSVGGAETLKPTSQKVRSPGWWSEGLPLVFHGRLDARAVRQLRRSRCDFHPISRQGTTSRYVSGVLHQECAP
jgi:hypothetical protein